ncbi:hypothetical protein [Campylobacter sp. US33a]|uniref:hypothetical protein n=1 Tax=Campylobacter sp. US33a TaxID=2498120 RepID=UPI001067FF71|nr:hypothetical protein [Campylobacter sp. US33a]TEY01596.1 hypothetical protein ELQ16_07460 [Campylobacter sp. US33a]
MKLFFLKAVLLVGLVTMFSACGSNGDDYLTLEFKNQVLEQVAQPTLAIQAKKDIIIKSVSINRGKCKVGLNRDMDQVFTFSKMYGQVGINISQFLPRFVLEKDLPKNLTFSESIDIPIKCELNSVIETTIDTNEGIFSWTWSR